MEKSIQELAAMSREELYEEAVIMRGRIILLRKKLDHAKGCLELAERTPDTINH